MNLILKLVLFVWLALCSGCNLTVVKKAQAYTLADVQAALVMAQQAQDKYAITCWSEVINWVQNAPNVTQPIVGAASTVEDARITALFVNAGIPSDVRRDCAAIGIAL